jgi:hypoxanthine phosphoribosyltransferase
MAGIPADALIESWDSVEAISRRLAELIKAGGERFDAMVVVPRGGYYPASIVARGLGFGAVDMLQAAVGSYHDERTVQGRFQLGQMPTDKEVAAKKLLIIEDVCDSGRTLSFLTERFLGQGAELVRSGVLHYKPGLSRTGFVPDWFVKETDKWIVYPWEQAPDNS